MERIKLIFKIAAYSSFLILVIWYSSGSILKSYDLAQNGKVTPAKVIAYQYSESSGRKGRTNRHYDHLIAFNEHKGLIDFGEEVKVGTQLYIVYSETNPTNFVAGKSKLSVFEYLKQEHGVVGLIVGAFIVALLPLEIFALTRQFLYPPYKAKPTQAEIRLEQIEIDNSRVRLKKPLKRSLSIGLTSFVLFIIIGDHGSQYIDLIITSASFSAAIFVFAYIATYKPRKG